jgi:hypothetical protein
VIFLSDGQDYVSDDVMYKMCRSASSQGFVYSHCNVIFHDD